MRTFESISVIFHLRAILRSPEVIKGQKLLNVIIFFRKHAVISGTMIARKTHGKAIDSFWTLLFIRSSSKLTSGQRLSLHRSNIVKIDVLGYFFLSRITFEPAKINSWQWHYRVSLIHSLRKIFFYPERSRSNFDHRSRSRGYQNRSCCISVDSPQWAKHNEAIPSVLCLSNRKLLAKICL